MSSTLAVPGKRIPVVPGNVHRELPSVAVPPPTLSLSGILILAILYAGLAVLYSALVALGHGHLSLADVLGRSAIDYAVKASLFFPIWYVTVRRLDLFSWRWKLSAHVLVCPLFVVVWITVYDWIVFATGALPPYLPNRKWEVFYAVLFYAVQFAVVHTVRSSRVLQIREGQQAALRELARTSELAALKAQLNPHFLFNTLNSINAAIPKENDAARSLIASLASLLRRTLESTKKDRITLKVELAIVSSYIDLELSRFGDRLRVVYDIDPELVDVLLPPMILQPLVENAVRHGVSKCIGGGTITIRVCRRRSRVRVRVEDTGMGVSSEGTGGAGPGLGLQNSDARLRLTFGESAGLSWESSPEGGFAVEFLLPYDTTGVSLGDDL